MGNDRWPGRGRREGVMDYIELDTQIDDRKFAFSGFFAFGKAAMWAAALGSEIRNGLFMRIRMRRCIIGSTPVSARLLN